MSGDTEEDTYELKVSIDGKEQIIHAPKSLKIREKQNSHCHAKGHFCAQFNEDLTCLEPIIAKNGELKGFEMRPCRYNTNNAFSVTERVYSKKKVKKENE